MVAWNEVHYVEKLYGFSLPIRTGKLGFATNSA